MIEQDSKYAKIKEFVQGKNENDLIEVLHRVQSTYDYIPREVATMVAMELKIPLSKIYGVATFYTGFTLAPKGKYQISVCMGTACYVKGAEDILNKISETLDIGIGETTDDLLFSLIETRCVGDCANAPIVIVNDKVYNKVSVDDVSRIIADIGEAEKASAGESNE